MKQIGYALVTTGFLCLIVVSLLTASLPTIAASSCRDRLPMTESMATAGVPALCADAIRQVLRYHRNVWIPGCLMFLGAALIDLSARRRRASIDGE